MEENELNECVELCVEEFGMFFREECERECRELIEGDPKHDMRG